MSTPKIGLFNMTLPAEGPACVPVNVDMSATTKYTVDLTQAVNDKAISFVSGAWIDNSANAHDLTLTCAGSEQRIIFPASSQGWLPLYLTNPPVLTMEQGAFGDWVRFVFVNFPVFPFMMP